MLVSARTCQLLFVWLRMCAHRRWICFYRRQMWHRSTGPISVDTNSNQRRRSSLKPEPTHFVVWVLDRQTASCFACYRNERVVELGLRSGLQSSQVYMVKRSAHYHRKGPNSHNSVTAGRLQRLVLGHGWWTGRVANFPGTARQVWRSSDRGTPCLH